MKASVGVIQRERSCLFNPRVCWVPFVVAGMRFTDVEKDAIYWTGMLLMLDFGTATTRGKMRKGPGVRA
jgi:hypothetical protein